MGSGARLHPPGSTVYTCMLNKRGGVESDLTVSRISPGDPASPLAPAFEGKSPEHGDAGVGCVSAVAVGLGGGRRLGLPSRSSAPSLSRCLFQLHQCTQRPFQSWEAVVAGPLQGPPAPPPSPPCSGGRRHGGDCIYLMAATWLFPPPPLSPCNPIIRLVPGGLHCSSVLLGLSSPGWWL